mgnify:CR=1 FL=1
MSKKKKQKKKQKQKQKKVRAFQLASQCNMNFKEFQAHAEALGVSLHSPQNSLEEAKALKLLEAVQNLLKANERAEAVAPPVQPETPEVEIAYTSDEVAPLEASKNSQIPEPTQSIEAREAPVQEQASVEFSFQHSHTYPGDTLYVVGNLPELGAWNPQKAIAMDANAWPQWKTSLSLPKGVKFEYKLMIRNTHGDFWEAGENRYCTLSQKEPTCTIEGQFR